MNSGVHTLIVVLGVMQGILFMLAAFIFLHIAYSPLPAYIAVPDNYLHLDDPQSGKYFQPRPAGNAYKVMTNLSQPMRSVDEVSDLAAATAANALTLNFVGYYDQLEQIRSRFTERGWKSFGQSLISSGFIDAVLKKKLSTSAVVIGTPVLLNRGMLNGNYAWKFQMPVLVTYQSASEKKTQNQIVTIVFTRVPLVGPGAEVGIAVDSFVTSV